jgi:hypothetical protein
MEKYYPANIEPWGDVWDPKKTVDWNHKQGGLAPLVLGMDYLGYDVAHKLPPGWLERTERSYKMQAQYNKPANAAPAGFGYGQGYITESALLLDKMSDAAKRIDWMAKLIFAPRQQYPYRVPEGLIVNEDGSMWRRWGDLGNLYQVNEVLYTAHLIVGIDDLNPQELVIMPRLPRDWKTMEVKRWPVRTMSGGSSQIVLLDMQLKHVDKSNVLALEIKSDKSIDAAKIRFGPFDVNTKSIHLKINGKKTVTPLETIGDSNWCWSDAHFEKTKTSFVFSAISSN